MYTCINSTFLYINSHIFLFSTPDDRSVIYKPKTSDIKYADYFPQKRKFMQTTYPRRSPPLSFDDDIERSNIRYWTMVLDDKQ